MRDDPFARLSGLDQKLFARPAPAPGNSGQSGVAETPQAPTPEVTDVGTSGRTSGRTSEASNERTDGGTNQTTEGRPNEGPNARTSQTTSGGTKKPTSGGKNGRTSGGTKKRTSWRPPGPPAERRVERHPYDFYEDQVLWLNRMKVEVHEKHGCRITANAMVRLALDLLRQDYQERGRRSHLVRTLVHRRAVRGAVYGGTDGPTDGGTSEAPEEEG